jgi:hypothetical protein
LSLRIEALKARLPHFKPAQVQAIYQTEKAQPICYGFDGQDAAGRKGNLSQRRRQVLFQLNGAGWETVKSAVAGQDFTPDVLSVRIGILADKTKEQQVGVNPCFLRAAFVFLLALAGRSHQHHHRGHWHRPDAAGYFIPSMPGQRISGSTTSTWFASVSSTTRIRRAGRAGDTHGWSSAAEEPPEAEADANAAADAEASDARDRPGWQRLLDLALAAGYTLRTKADGWQRFCARLHVPAFLLWQDLPGFDRLQRSLALAEKAAFATEGRRRWLNAIRPAGAPELTEVPLTIEDVADATEEAFRQRVHWWGG